MIEAVVEAVDAPVVAGAGSNDTRIAVSNAERSVAVGAAGLLHVAPYYNRPSQAGLNDHFRACAAATDMPVLIYDIPGRTGRKVATRNNGRPARSREHHRHQGCGGRSGQTARLLSLAPPDTEIYSGDDGLTLPLLSVGAVGTIGVATHWVGNETAAMMKAFFDGDIEQSDRTQPVDDAEL